MHWLEKKRKELDMPIVEPIVIHDAELGTWNHPDIEEIVSIFKEDYDQINEECNVFTGPLVRFLFEESLQIAVVVEPEYYDRFVDNCMINKNGGESQDQVTDKIIMATQVCLLEDVWKPGGGDQFVFTNYGRALAKKLKNVNLMWLTPDIGLDGDDPDEWSICS